MLDCVSLVTITSPLLLLLHWILDGTYCSVADLLENTENGSYSIAQWKKCASRKQETVSL